MPTTTHPTTARTLAVLVESLGPFVEGGELVFANEPPPELDSALAVLHTGVRAVLTGQRWWGGASDKPRVVELNPAAPIPAGITLLAVEGDRRWDRMDPAARTELAYLFTADPAPGPSRSG